MYKIFTKILCTPHGYIQKFLLVMKLTTVFLIAALVHVSAAGLAQKISYVQKDATIKQVFDQVYKQTGYSILWTAQNLQADKKINADFHNASLDEVMKQCLDDQPLDYTIGDKTIVIKKKELSVHDKLKDQLKAELAQVTVTGRVVDELSNPMVGVTVKQKDRPTNATATDANGNYTLTVPDNNTVIVFSYIGYESQELVVKDLHNGSTINLKSISQNLHEVVVDKGYYKERQALSTGNVSIVSAKTIQEQPVSDPLQALIGRVAGLNIQQNSGEPGAYSTIRINGVNSIANGTAPLFIIDGVPFNSQSLSSPYLNMNALGQGTLGSVNQKGPSAAAGLSPFNALNPNDIENIEILKDADATAIYGSRGANGVIIITTKKGKAGDTRVSVDVSQGIGQVAHFVNLLNTQQYLAMRHEAFTNDGLKPGINDHDINGDWDTTRYTNWQKLLIGGTAHYTNAQASISGGTANTQFYISGGYNRQTTVFPGDYEDKRGSLHLSLSHVSNDHRFRMQFTAGYVNDNDLLPIGDFTTRITLAPDAPSVYNANGSINWQIINGTASWSNPLASLLNSSTSITNNLGSSMDISYLVLPGLTIKSNLGYSHVEMNENLIEPSDSFAPPNNNNPNQRISEFSNSFEEIWNIEPQLSYQRKIAKGTLNALIGATFEQNTAQSTTETASGFASNALLNNPQAATNYKMNNDTYTIYRYQAVYGRLGYTWNDKYLFNLTVRRDGSSRFGPGQQFGDFGAIGTGWIFSKEDFLKNRLPWLSFGKLRLSYGTTGNDQLTDYQYLSTYTSNSTTYQGNAGLAPTSLTNSDYHWEVVKKLEGGIDVGLFNDRLNITVNYFRNRTGNQLVGYPLPSTAGFGTVQFNLPAIVQNTGLEVDLNTVNIKSNDFNWSTTINFTLPQNKLVAYPGISGSPYNNTYVVGQSLFIQKLYGFTGVNPQIGQLTYATQNSNGAPSYPQDLIVSQPVTQKMYGGIENSFSYKGFGLDVFFQIVKQNGMLSYYPPGAGQENNNYPTAILNHWQNVGDIAPVGKFSTKTASDPNFDFSTSTATITDASFIRLKNLAIWYKFPTTWQQWAHMQNAKIYLQGQNLFTLTHFIGMDPETQGLTLPPLRVITAGISASF
jgi:TonB-linked SusC/RagA family outer membrane protein